MIKSVLLSIRPEWCKKILGGEKTTEIRKSRPNLETPFRCYIYCVSAWQAEFCKSTSRILCLLTLTIELHLIGLGFFLA